MIWVTSRCNLHCKLCSQGHTMRSYPEFDMQKKEVDYIVENIKRRHIKIWTIELTGGEASLWDHLEYGVTRFREICDDLTLVTNGNNPERVIALGMRRWIVSSSQANPVQMATYKRINGQIVYNSHRHKRLPESPVPGTLPAVCCVQTDPYRVRQNNILYLDNKIWYCCNAFALTERVPLSDSIYCGFEEDFISKFKDKRFDETICAMCLCNHRVWNKI